MSKRHRVEPGDCITSIAFRNGFAVDTLWDHPENAELKQRRGSPFTLVPGDVVFVPDLTLREEPCATGKRHVFRRRDVPERLKLRFLDAEDKPRVGVPYVLTIDGQESQGTTNGDGEIVAWISPSARRGRVALGEGEVMELSLGHLQPITERAGVAARLAALGYLANEDPGDAALRKALQAFQDKSELEPSGEADEATRSALREAYGG